MADREVATVYPLAGVLVLVTGLPEGSAVTMRLPTKTTVFPADAPLPSGPRLLMYTQLPFVSVTAMQSFNVEQRILQRRNAESPGARLARPRDLSLITRAEGAAVCPISWRDGKVVLHRIW